MPQPGAPSGSSGCVAYNAVPTLLVKTTGAPWGWRCCCLSALSAVTPDQTLCSRSQANVRWFFCASRARGSPWQATSSSRMLVKSASMPSTASCSGSRSNSVRFNSSRVCPLQRDSTAEKQVARASVGVTPNARACSQKARHCAFGTLKRRRVKRTAVSAAGSQARGSSGASGSVSYLRCQ